MTPEQSLAIFILLEPGGFGSVIAEYRLARLIADLGQIHLLPVGAIFELLHQYDAKRYLENTGVSGGGK